ncbi:nucleotidyltransferase domain-containing protein [Streptomyces sp. NPDC055099]
MDGQEAAKAQALRVVTELFPRTVGALLGGSAAQGRATAASDLDVAVLLPDSDISRREVIRHEGRTVELFLNALADIPEFFAWDRARRRGTVLFVYDQGLPPDSSAPTPRWAKPCWTAISQWPSTPIPSR